MSTSPPVYPRCNFSQASTPPIFLIPLSPGKSATVEQLNGPTNVPPFGNRLAILSSSLKRRCQFTTIASINQLRSKLATKRISSWQTALNPGTKSLIRPVSLTNYESVHSRLLSQLAVLPTDSSSPLRGVFTPSSRSLTSNLIATTRTAVKNLPHLKISMSRARKSSRSKLFLRSATINGVNVTNGGLSGKDTG